MNFAWTGLALFLALFTSSISFSKPPSFPHQQGKAVFIDVLQATHQLTYDVAQSHATVDTTFLFSIDEPGYPIFDLVENPLGVWLADESVGQVETPMPGGVSKVRVVQKQLSPGKYTMRVRAPLKKMVIFSPHGVSSAFWMADIYDREFSEMYIPANLEYDQYPSEFHIAITGASKRHEIFSNGVVNEISTNQFHITFPEHFSSSSLFYHLAPKNDFKQKSFDYTTRSGRTVPVTVYTRHNTRWLWTFSEKAKESLSSLEQHYGEWPHPKLLIYASGTRGGMEYTGATVTSLMALDHELMHSYIARGALPRNGNAGWIDEAVASWRDQRYPSMDKAPTAGAKMGGHSLYQRKTDVLGYTHGMQFLSFIDHSLKPLGGLNRFLNVFLRKYMRASYLTEDFQRDLEKFSSRSWQSEFDHAVYGKNGVGKSFGPIENPFHPKRTEKQLLELL